MKERRTKLPFTEPCGNGLLRFNNWDGTQLSKTKAGGGEETKKRKESKKGEKKSEKRKKKQKTKQQPKSE